MVLLKTAKTRKFSSANLPSLRYAFRYVTIFHLTIMCNIATPVIDTPASSTIVVLPGSSVTLSCTSRGSPPDTFTWMKDGGPTVLQSTNISILNYTSTTAVFRANYSITNFVRSDAGVYTCTVTNGIGSDNATFTVYLSGKLLVY